MATSLSNVLFGLIRRTFPLALTGTMNSEQPNEKKISESEGSREGDLP
jgi:hypothetical protein